MKSPKQKAKYLIETFQDNREEIRNVLNQIICVAPFLESEYYKKVKREVNKIKIND